jgi:hypothetical protein
MTRPEAGKVAARLSSIELREPRYFALLASAEKNESTETWLIRRAVAEFPQRHGSSTAPARRLRSRIRTQSWSAQVG